MTLLILGGTAEARALARELAGGRRRVVSSLAGRVDNPALPAGEVRIGGFGGPGGLASYVREQQVDVIVDATHPFAARMSAHAAAAARSTGVPLLRLDRPGWADHPAASAWHWVADLESAREQAERLGTRPFLSTGRQTLHAFERWRDRYALVRLVEPPEVTLPAAWEVVVSRGPYPRDTEVLLLREHRVDVLITKDSGGEHTVGKLDAAGALDIPVVVVRRPPGPSGVPAVTTVGAAVAWARDRGTG